MTPSNSPNPQSLASSYQKRQERGSEGRGKPERRVKEKEERERWKERERARGKLAPWEFPLEIDEDTESASSVFPDPAGAAGINMGAQRWKAQKRQLWDLWGLKVRVLDSQDLRGRLSIQL